MKVKEKEREENPPNLDRFYGPLRNYVKMVARGYHKLFMLDASGGLGKTYNVKDVLSDELDPHQWTHQRGFTTPVELYKTLYQSQRDGHVLFLDDMSGLRNNQKAIDMLKAATESDGDENWVEYRTSQDIEHPSDNTKTLPNTFCFRGSIIMSFNDTPSTEDFNALKDRAVFYEFDLSYQERLDLISEAAMLEDFSELSVSEQQSVADWMRTTTNPSMDVTLRTFSEICSMYHFGNNESTDWKEMALEIFDLDYEKYIIIDLRENSDMTIDEQISEFKEKTGRSKSYYYDLFNEIKDERMT